MSELRKIFFNGEPGDQNFLEIITNTSANIVERKENPDFDKFLKTVDFATLWKIIEEIAKKSGIKFESVNKPADIYNADLSKANNGEIGGQYQATDNTIQIDYPALEKEAQLFEVDANVMALHTLIHEITHAFTYIEFSININNKKFEFNTKEAYFSEKNDLKKGETKTTNNTLNEAITELVTQEILDEYIKRTGILTKDQTNQYNKSFIKKDRADFYLIVLCLKVLIKNIAEKTETDTEIVKNAFVRGLFYKQYLKDPEIKEWFSKNISPKFLSDTEKANSPSELLAIITKYKNKLL